QAPAIFNRNLVFPSTASNCDLPHSRFYELRFTFHVAHFAVEGRPAAPASLFTASRGIGLGIPCVTCIGRRWRPWIVHSAVTPIRQNTTTAARAEARCRVIVRPAAQRVFRARNFAEIVVRR